MPEKLTSEGNLSGTSAVKELEPTMVVAAANTPASYFQQLSDVPSGLKVVVESQVYKLTTKSIRKAIRRNATIAQYWLNVPFVDPLVSVSRIFKTLDVLSFNYERQHTDSFWLQYPHAMVLSNAERAAMASIDDTWCRLNRRALCRRFAHFAFDYIEAKKMHIASLINLNTLTRLNGNDAIKHIASDVRWAYINTRTNMYERFPAPVGTEAVMIEAAKYALGKTTYGADIVAFPLYATDVAGNRGNHSLSLTENLQDTKTNQEDMKLNAATDADLSITLGAAAQIEIAIAKSYLTNSEIDGDELKYASLSRAGKPKSITVENGATFVATVTNGTEDDDETAQPTASAYARLNDDGLRDVDDPFKTAHSQLTKSVWNAWQFWDDYLMRFFPQMSDPYSDTRNIMDTLLHLVQPAMKVEDVNKAVRATKVLDMADLASKMVYKKDNMANTATFIKWAPLLWKQNFDPDNDDINIRNMSQFDIYSDDPHPGIVPGVYSSVFEANFNRYPVDNDNIAEVILVAKEWPHINPSFFPNRELKDTHHVINAVDFGGDPFLKAGMDVRITPITGRYASFVDYLLAYSHNPAECEINSAGIDQETFTHFASTPADNIVVFDECPDSPFVLSQPILDPTDLYQCGFNVLLSSDSKYWNEWEEFLLDPNHYTGGLAAADIARVSLRDSQPMSPAWYDSGNTTHRAHVANPDYLAAIKTAFVFVGVGLFNHPVAALAAVNSNHFSLDFDCTNENAANFIDSLLTGSNTVLRLTEQSLRNAAIRESRDIKEGNFSSMEQAIVVASTDTMHKYVSVFTFAPDYPPVLIARQYSSTSSNGSLPVDPSFNNLTFLQGWTFDDISAAGNRVNPRIDQTAGGSITENASPFIATKKKNLLNFRNLALKSLIFFVKSIKFNIPNVTIDGRIVDDDEPTAFEFHTHSDWLLSMSGNCKAMFAGLRDTIPFWDRVLKAEAAKAPVIATGPDFATNDIMVPPRSLVSKANAKVDYANRRNKSSKFDSEVTTGSLDTPKSERRPSSGSHRAGKSHRYGNRGSSRSAVTIDSDGLSDKDVDKFTRENNVNAHEDSPLNQTNKQDRSKIQKSNESPYTGDDLAKALQS